MFNATIKTLFGALCLLFAQYLVAQPLHYTVQYEKSGVPRLSVDLEFFHGDRDTIWFRLPVRINRTEDTWRCYRDLKAEGGSIVLSDTGYIAVKRDPRLTKPVMKLHYEVLAIEQGEAVTRANCSGPLIREQYFHLRGYSLFLEPDHYSSFDVTVDWGEMPKGWKTLNSFGAGNRQQKFKLNDTDWQRTIWVGGDFRLYRREVAGKPLFFAVRGEWLFEDTTLLNVITRTVESQRALWDDFDMPFYAVTLIPFVAPRQPREGATESLCQGYGLRQSFVTYADPTCLLNKFIDLFNHEMMHEWIGGKIDQGVSTPERSMRWFAEGFTEYYSMRNRLNAGFMNAEAFFKEINGDFFQQHYNSPYALMPQTEADERQYESNKIDRVSYDRGCIMAMYLDCAIRARTNNEKTLFSALPDLLDYTWGTGRNLTEGYDFFVETLSEYLGENVEPILETYIDQGALIPASKFRVPVFLDMKTDVKGIPQFGLNPSDKDALAKWLK